jgi:putative serine protease PepD
VGAAVIALSLVSGGFALGTVLNEESDSATTTNTLRSAVDTETGSEAASGTSSSPSVLPPDVPGPLADEDAEEPVAAVAAALNPSVVRILTTFGQGSGIVWDAANGYIVTNQHVVGDESAVSVTFADGSQVDGVVIGGSSATDVAVVQVDPSAVTLIEAVFAPTSTVEVGQLAIAIGSPFGLDQTVTAGIVSAIRINLSGGSNPLDAVPVEMIQTDAPINPGNSGGPLADRQGRVIGMNSSIRTDGVSDGNVGVGFAVPSDTIVLIAQRIVNGESLELAYLGVTGSLEADNNGVLVTDVVPGSPADLAGLDVGDLIVGLDGKAVDEIGELSAAIKLYQPGELVELEIVRGESRLFAEVVLGALSDAN